MKPKRDKIKSLAWTGLWKDGSPGWYTSEFLGQPKARTGAHPNYSLKGSLETVYRCEVTVRLLKDKRGRYITKTT